MENLENSISLLAFLLGITSLIITGISKLVDYFTQKNALKELKEKEFEKLLDSTDIIKLGTYLDNEIGKLSISNYVDNEELNQKVDKLTNSLISYIGTDDSINKEKAEQVEKEERTKTRAKMLREKVIYPDYLYKEIEKIFKELYVGETWNALAKLRRFLEAILSNYAENKQITFDRNRTSVNRLVEILYSKDFIDLELKNDLKYSAYISNRAIHGEEIDKEEAEAAIYIGSYAIERLLNKAPNKS